MNLIFVLGACVFFVSCKNEVNQAEIKHDSIPKEVVENPTSNISDNSQNSLDWAGTYKGITPCADCEGIETEIVLNLDLTYVIKTKYLGKGNGKIFEEKGNFVWDKTGGSISLQGRKGATSQYIVGENQLIQLDIYGKPITGNLADML